MIAPDETRGVPCEARNALRDPLVVKLVVGPAASDAELSFDATSSLYVGRSGSHGMCGKPRSMSANSCIERWCRSRNL